MADFPFDIADVATLLKLRVRRRQADNIYTDCPICGDCRGKMNINLQKNVFRCNYCDESGGMIALYAKVYGIGNSDAYREICDALQTGNRPAGYEIKTAQTPASIQSAGLAGIDVIHQTLSLLLGMLELSEPHRLNLRARGMTDGQIDRLGYKSTPPFYFCRALAERLVKQSCTVQGVPGFYLDDSDRWTVKFSTRTAGILIPVRGIDGLIRGAQIRLDIPIKDENEDADKPGTKYLWLSSSNKRMGVTSGSPVHFVGDPFAGAVYVTEGALKADAAHCLMNRSFAAVAGANNLNQLDPVFSMLAHNGTKLIVEAHDMDKFSNAMIEKGASKIYVMAHKYGMESRRLTWNPNYKGIDDWQLALKNRAKEGDRLNFKERFIAGLCGSGAIEGDIRAWHGGAGGGRPLHEYLGLTQDEYEVFVQGGDVEALLLAQRKTQRFRIYQLEFADGEPTKPFAFQGIKALHKAGYEQPPASAYRLVFDAGHPHNAALPEKGVLDQIFGRYNGDLPGDYNGRSVSPSDVIELYDDDTRRYFYCETEGFAPVKFSPALALPLKAQAR